MFCCVKTFSRFVSRSLLGAIPKTTRSFYISSTFKMPEPLKQSEVEKGQDPTVAKQWDDDTPLETKFEDFAAIADKLKVGMMGTFRNGIGVWPYPATLSTTFTIILTELVSP